MVIGIEIIYFILVVFCLIWHLGIVFKLLNLSGKNFVMCSSMAVAFLVIHCLSFLISVICLFSLFIFSCFTRILSILLNYIFKSLFFIHWYSLCNYFYFFKFMSLSTIMFWFHFSFLIPRDRNFDYLYETCSLPYLSILCYIFFFSITSETSYIFQILFLCFPSFLYYFSPLKLSIVSVI